MFWERLLWQSFILKMSMNFNTEFGGSEIFCEMKVQKMGSWFDPSHTWAQTSQEEMIYNMGKIE